MLGFLFGLISATPYLGKPHDWLPATCTSPKTCTLCGQTRGEVDSHNHDWQEASSITLWV